MPMQSSQASPSAFPLAQAMVLAAGRGERMRPLTDVCPKPLLTVRGQPLLAYPLNALARAGVRATVINTGWLGDQIEDALGDAYLPTPTPLSPSSVEPMRLRYSREGRGAGEALETAGGILRALPWLDHTFWVVAGDVFMPDFDFAPHWMTQLEASPCLAHVWLVPNPTHNPGGDFGLSAQGLALNKPSSAVAQSTTPAGVATQTTYTFSTLAIYKKAFFEALGRPIPPGNPDGVKAPLAPMLRAAMDQGLVSASLYEGLWVDVGTPERLEALQR